MYVLQRGEESSLILLGINVDIHHFLNTAACFYFLAVLEPLVSHMTLWSVTLFGVTKHIHALSQMHKKPDCMEGEQYINTQSNTQSFGQLWRDFPWWSICRLSSKKAWGFFNVKQWRNSGLKRPSPETHGAVMAQRTASTPPQLPRVNGDATVQECHVFLFFHAVWDTTILLNFQAALRGCDESEAAEPRPALSGQRDGQSWPRTTGKDQLAWSPCADGLWALETVPTSAGLVDSISLLLVPNCL